MQSNRPASGGLGGDRFRLSNIGSAPPPAGSRGRSRSVPHGWSVIAQPPETTATSEPVATADRRVDSSLAMLSEEFAATNAVILLVPAIREVSFPKVRDGPPRSVTSPPAPALDGPPRSPLPSAGESARTGHRQISRPNNNQSAHPAVRGFQTPVTLPTVPAERADWPPARSRRCARFARRAVV